MSESLRVQTLGMVAGSPPGGLSGGRLGEARSGAGLSSTAGWRAVVRVLRSPLTVLDDLVTTVFPSECRVCAAPLVSASRLPVCRKCLDSPAPRTAVSCGRCGDGLNLDLDLEDLRFMGMHCHACRLVPPDFVRAVAFGSYEDELREMIHLLKFNRMPALARPLGKLLVQAVASLEVDFGGQAVAVIAVPLHRSAQRQRGYNQARLLADVALRELKRTRPAMQLRPLHHALCRQRSTASQYTLSQKGRRRNLADAFKATSDVRGRQVLLVDDIFTSGSTARECARVLMQAGAAKVWVATVARASRVEVRRGVWQAPGAPDTARWDRTVGSQGE